MSHAAIPAGLNLALCALHTAAALTLVALLPAADTPLRLLPLLAAFVVVGNAIYFLLHEAEHAALHPNRRINDALGVGLAVLFPAPFALLRHAHLLHHRYNRAPEEAFDLYAPGDPVWWKRAQFYGLLTGAFYAVTVLAGPVLSLTPPALVRRLARPDRQTAAFVAHLDAPLCRRIRWQTALTLAVHALILAALGDAWPRYLLLYAAFGLSWSTMQYLHHYGAPRDARDGAIDLRPVPGLRRLWLNHHLHRTHHRHPDAPWPALPALAEADGSRPASWWRQYLRQWRGPRLVTPEPTERGDD